MSESDKTAAAKPAEAEPAGPEPAEAGTGPGTESPPTEIEAATTEQAEVGVSVPPNPLKGFRGVMAGTLVMEAITVALALFAVDQLYGGLNSTVGYLVGFDALGLVLACGFLRRDWIIPVILVLQLVMVGCIFSAVAVGIVGLLFLVVWIYLLWLRREVSRRMAAGQLPGQQPSRQS
jgi:hypothetical protein